MFLHRAQGLAGRELQTSHLRTGLRTVSISTSSAYGRRANNIPNYRLNINININDESYMKEITDEIVFGQGGQAGQRGERGS